MVSVVVSDCDCWVPKRNPYCFNTSPNGRVYLIYLKCSDRQTISDTQATAQFASKSTYIVQDMPTEIKCSYLLFLLILLFLQISRTNQYDIKTNKFTLRILQS